MELFYAVELFTQFITYVMMVSGVPPCISMLRSDNPHGMPYEYFLANFVNAILGIGYGLLLENMTFIQVNVMATTFNVVYILSYLYVCRARSSKLRQALRQLLVCGGILLCIYLYLTKITIPNKTLDNLGVVLLVWTTVLLLTPLLQVKQCIEDRSASSVSMTMLVSGFLCSSAWLLYGYLLKDINIYGPNIVGVATNLCIWVSVAVYGLKPAENKHGD